MEGSSDDRRDQPVGMPPPLDYKPDETPAEAKKLGTSLGCTAGVISTLVVGAATFLFNGNLTDSSASRRPAVFFFGAAIAAALATVLLTRAQARRPFALAFLIAVGVCALVEGLCFYGA